MSITRSVAEFVANTRYEDLPPGVVDLAKNSFLDTLGVALGGAVEEGARILGGFVRASEAAPVASVIGHGFKTSPRNAALMNGTSGHLLGFSDLSTVQSVHPSVSALPALLAVAEETGASGKDALLAHILAVELVCKMATALNPGFNIKGWHPCSVLGAFGATAAAGKILGLDAQQTANALGLAGMETSGIKAGMGTMAKAYGTGRAAENGVVAASLAARGFTGPTSVLEGTDGFLQTFGDGAGGDGLVASLGNPYEFVSPGIALKPYPSCTCSHTSIDAVLKLRKEHDFALEEVDSVECLVSPAVANYLRFPEPRGPLEAKYSLHYCCAAALVDGEVTIGTFAPERLADPEIRGLMKRIQMSISPELAALGYMPASAPYGSTAVIRLKSGKELRRRQDMGAWEPSPPSREAIVPKYRACAGRVLGPKQVDESIEIVEHLEESPNVRRLMDLVRG